MIITINLDNTITSYDDDVQAYLELNPPAPGHNVAATIAQGYAQGLLKNLKPARGASEVLWELNNQGHHIRIFVNRFILHGQNHKVIAHTAEWLDRNDIPYREIFFLTTNPLVHTHLHIDADPRIISLLKDQTTIVKYATPKNDHVEGNFTVTNWEEVLELVERLDPNRRPINV